jgi:hypothetical protein
MPLALCFLARENARTLALVDEKLAKEREMYVWIRM